MPTTWYKNTLYRLLLPFFAPGCGRHPVTSFTGHDLFSVHDLSALLRRHHVLGSAVLVSSPDNYSLICSSSASPLHEAHPDTFFRVASVTKSATALLCMRLSEMHIIDLDMPVSDYFSSVPEVSPLKNVTVTHLLSHTSGLSDPPCLELSLEKGVPFTQLLSDALINTPGTAFHYSNFGFGLIGCVLESVLDKPIGQIFRDYLFDPLNMNATLEGCLLPPDRIMPVTRIFPYKKQDLVLTRLGSEPLRNPDPFCHYGHTAGSMYTDVFSLHTMLKTLAYSNPFLSDHSRDLLCEEHASYGKISPSLSYGLGVLRIRDSKLSDHMIYGHQGFAYGCADGAFWEADTGNMLIMLNGGCSEARIGRLGILNRDLLHWAFRKELPLW